MTTEQRISDWMKDREDELVEALRPLIEAESTLGEAKPGMPFGRARLWLWTGDWSWQKNGALRWKTCTDCP